MNWEVALVLFVLIAMLAGFVWERIPAELTALAGLAVLLVCGVLSTNDALAAFSNPAPVTVGAMFVLSAALEKCGVIQMIARYLQSFQDLRVSLVLPCLILLVAAISAFINNTPVVVVFLPVVLSLAKQLDIPASKLLIPLSYASIFGGTCTLIGTSTNIVVSSVAESRGIAPFSMFELAWIGVPLLIAGTLYILFFGYRLLPKRETLSSILSVDELREYILEVYVTQNSSLLGKKFADLPAVKASGIRALEIIRHGISIKQDPTQPSLQVGDRLLVAASARTLSKAQSSPESSLAKLIREFGLEQISAMRGSFIEVAVRSESRIAGYSFNSLNFRQRYRLTPVAVHRNGMNLRDNFTHIPLKAGDILLLLGGKEAIEALRKDPDFVLIDETPIEANPGKIRLLLTVATIVGVVAVSSIGLIPIAGAAIIGAVLLVLSGCLSTHDAYRAIQWPILFLIFAMLGIGQALESSGATSLIANGLVTTVTGFFSEAWQPIVLLAGIYLITTILTEILSNNAAAVLMTTLAIGAAQSLGVDARPFLIAVAAAASASFATPIGYQTNTYVYGIGGYRFLDFVKIGVPLNLVAFVITVLLVPLIWEF